ncbi:hypothetical protein CR513_38306, partial [Mucuna pruriens]
MWWRDLCYINGDDNSSHLYWFSKRVFKRVRNKSSICIWNDLLFLLFGNKNAGADPFIRMGRGAMDTPKKKK